MVRAPNSPENETVPFFPDSSLLSSGNPALPQLGASRAKQAVVALAEMPLVRLKLHVLDPPSFSTLLEDLVLLDSAFVAKSALLLGRCGMDTLDAPAEAQILRLDFAAGPVAAVSVGYLLAFLTDGMNRVMAHLV